MFCECRQAAYFLFILLFSIEFYSAFLNNKLNDVLPLLPKRALETLFESRDFSMGRPHVDVRRRLVHGSLFSNKKFVLFYKQREWRQLKICLSITGRVVSGIIEMAGYLRVNPITYRCFCGISNWPLGRSHASMEWFVSIQLQFRSAVLTILFISTAARISLAAQNLLVVACAVCVALTFYFREKLAIESINYIFIFFNLPSAN